MESKRTVDTEGLEICGACSCTKSGHIAAGGSCLGIGGSCVCKGFVPTGRYAQGSKNVLETVAEYERENGPLPEATEATKGASEWLRLVADHARFGSADREIILGAADALEAKDAEIEALRLIAERARTMQRRGATASKLGAHKVVEYILHGE